MKSRFIKPESIESKLLRRVARSESLVDRHPELEKQWHESNFYEPSLFTPFSQQVSVWTCANGHVIVSPIAQRTRALDIGSKFQGCPVCAGRACHFEDSIAAKYPELLEEWHSYRNGKRPPREIYFDSDLLAFWQCRCCKHVFRCRVSSRTTAVEPQGCPVCSRESRVI